MKKPYSNDYDHSRLKNRLWALEFAIFIVCLLLVGVGQAQTVTNISPAHLETEVDIESEIVVTFDIPVTINDPAASIWVFNVDDGFSVLYEFQMQDPEVVVSSRTVTVTPPDVLPPLTTLSFRIDSDAINGYSGLFVHQFTTENDVPPSLISTSPSIGETSADIFTDLVLTFDEDVEVHAGQIGIRRTDIGANWQLISTPDPSVTVNGNEVTIDINNLPMSTPFEITILASTIRDLNGHFFNGFQVGTPTPWTFTTEDPTPPQVVSFSPPDEATDIPVTGQTFTITFDEDIMPQGFFQISNSSGSFEQFQTEDLTFIGTNTISFTPQNAFETGTDYTITLSGVRDLKAAQLVINDPEFWNFRTIEATPPQLVGLSPATGSVNVNVGTNLVLSFDENVFLQSNGDFDLVEIRESNGGALFESFDLPAANVTGLGTTQITINPTTNFSDNTEYYVRILNAFEDDMGTDFDDINDTQTWTFDTGQPPSLVSFTPSHNSTDVAVDENLVLVFDEPVVLGSASSPGISIRKVSDDLTVDFVQLNGAEASGFGTNTITVNPAPDLPFGEELYVVFPINVFADLTGNSVPAFLDNTIWRFTTEAADLTAPAVVSLSPADNSTGATVDQELVITFDEPIQHTGSTASIFIHKKSDHTILASMPMNNPSFVDFDGDAVNITLSQNLPNNTEVYVNVPGGAIEDLSGNNFPGILDTETWTFTVGTTSDVTPPAISSLSPSDEATDVAVDASFTITFDEDVFYAGNAGFINARRKSDDSSVGALRLDSEVTFNQNQLSFSFNSDLPEGEELYITIEDNRIEDASGNLFPGILDNETWDFTTEIPAPMPASFFPANGAIDVAINTNLNLTHDQLIQEGTGFVRVRRFSDDQLIASYDVEGAQVSVFGTTLSTNPSTDLPNGVQLYVETDATVAENLSGIPAPALVKGDWVFTTVASSDMDPPLITSLSPTDGTTDVGVNDVFTITFNESIQAGSGFVSVHRTSNDIAVFLAAASDPSVTISGNSLSFNPFSGNTTFQNTDFYVQVQSTAVEDLNGNAFAGISDETTWNITTEELTPNVVSFSPVNGSVDVPVDQTFTIQYDKPVQKGSGLVGFVRQDNDVAVEFFDVTSSEVSISGSTVMINPNNDLPEELNLYVSIVASAIESTSGVQGNAIVKGDWNFTTSTAPDNTAPSVSSFNPVDDAIDVPLDATISVTFDEPMDDTRGRLVITEIGNPFNFRILDVGSQVSISGNTATVVSMAPFSLQNGTNYYMAAVSGTFADLAGNTFDGFTDEDTWNFTTETSDTDPPLVQSFSPTDEGEEVAIDANLIITFNEPVQSTGLSSAAQVYRQSDDMLLASMPLNNPGLASFSGNQLTLTLSANLPYGTQVYVTLPSDGIEDLNGNDFAGFSDNETWDFETNPAPDTDPPLVVTLSPSDDDTDVGISENLVITFNEDVLFDNNAATFELRRKSPDQLVEAFGIFGPRVTGDNSTVVTIDPTNDLLYDVEYYVLISGDNVFIDGGDNAFAGFLTADDWNFTTESEPDNTPPTITNFSPADGAVDVDNNDPIILTFSEDIQLTGFGPIRIRRVSNNAILHQIDPASANVSIVGNVVTIQPPGGFLSTEEEIEVYVNWSTTPFEDLAGNDFNGLFSSTDYRFTVNNVNPDMTPPSITSFSPADDATDVATDLSELTITFDEDVQKFHPGNIIIRNSSGDIIHQYFPVSTDNDVTINGNQATITLNQTLDFSTGYYVQLASTTFEDLAGNPGASWTDAVTWNFTTEAEPDNTAPSIVTLDPAHNETDVSIATTVVTATFDEDIKLITPDNINGGTIQAMDGGTNPVYSFGFDDVAITGNALSINTDIVSGGLAHNTMYRVRIFDFFISDLADNRFTGTAANGWNFTIEAEPDVTPPSVVSFSPADGETDVPLDLSELTITFDEDVQKSNPGNIILRDFSGDIIQQYYPAFSDPDVVVNGNVVTLNLSGNLTPGDFHYVQFLSGTIEDLAGNNYIGFNNASTWNFTAAKQDQTITFDPLVSRTYGDPTFDLSATATSGLTVTFDSSDPSVATVSGTIVTIVGAGTTTITASQDGDSEYAAAPQVMRDLVIDKADLTATADDQTKTYGDVNPGFSLAFTGFVNGDNSSVLDVLPSRSTTATTTSDAGTYEISVSGGSDDNYNYVYQNGTLTIEKATLTATADDQSKIYGEANPGFSLSFSGFVNGENSSVLDLLPQRSTSADETSDVGTYAIVVSGGSDNNYNYSYVNGTLTINPAALTITAEDKTKAFGESLPTFTLDYSGFVNGDNAGELNELPMISTTATSGSNVGVYPIQLSGGSDNNYTYMLVNGSLTITTADQTITIVPIADKITTDGSFAVSASTTSGLMLDYAIASGPATILGNTITLDGVSGTVVVEVSQSGNSNYNSATESTSFNVSDPAKSDQTITFDPISDKVFGESFTLNASASSGLVVDFSILSGSASLVGNEVTITGVGNVTIAADQPGDARYNPAMQVTRSFNVVKADQIVTVESIGDKITTDAPFNVVASVDTGLPLTYDVSGPASISGTLITLSGSTGTVVVTVTQIGDVNHNSASALTSFEVTEFVKSDQSISFNPIEDKVYGDVFTLDASATSGLSIAFSVVSGPLNIDGNEVTISGTGQATIAANQAGNSEYNAAQQVTQSFTINKADQVITIKAIEDKLSSDDPFDVVASVNSGLSLTYEITGPASISGTTITLDGSDGEVSLTAIQEGDDNYNAASESITFNVTLDQALSVQDKVQAIKFYPNPTRDYLSIESRSRGEVRIIDLNGKVLIRRELVDGKLDLRELDHGVYLLEVRTESETMRKRIVKAN